MTFQLHEKLAADTSLVVDLPLCRVLLMHDARFPWLILVPRLADLRELHRVPAADQAQLWEEITSVSTILERHSGAFKMNVAALGNQVPQLHVHVIARFAGDPAWPGPVWGVGEPQPYERHDLAQQLTQLRDKILAGQAS